MNTKPIFPGEKVFELHDRFGFPTDVCTEMVHDRGMLVDWWTYIISARNAGWTRKRTRNIIKTASQVFNYSTIEDTQFNKLLEQSLTIIEE